MCAPPLRRSLPKEPEPTASPTSLSGPWPALSPSSSSNSNASPLEHRLSDLANYRRDLAILDPAGGRSANPQHQANNPATGSLSQIAPWMAGQGTGTSTTPSNPGALPTSFYNDSSDNLSLASQLSPGLRPGQSRQMQTPVGSTADSPDAAYFNDERRPSIASITTTASSTGSKTSGQRGGFRKLQGFFGEEFPGRDSSESSLTPGTTAGKEQRSHSYSHARPHRDRNYSNATDNTREASPTSSRPRTPVPAPEVVPFLYQEADVRSIPSHPPCCLVACAHSFYYYHYFILASCDCRCPLYASLLLVSLPPHAFSLSPHALVRSQCSLSLSFSPRPLLRFPSFPSSPLPVLFRHRLSGSPRQTACLTFVCRISRDTARRLSETF